MDILTQRRHVALAVSLVLFGALILGPAAEAATPAPWMWTPVRAAGALKAKAPTAFADLEPFTVAGVSCAGASKPAGGRFDAFACTATVNRRGSRSQQKAWLKVRHAGNGSACVSRISLAKVSASCLAVPSQGGGTQTSKGSPAEAATAVRYSMQRRMDPSQGGQWQGFTRVDCTGSAGLYQCAFGDDISGTATVYFTNSGPVLYFTTLTCSTSAAALYPAGCKFP
jgi:hypothetical protein